WNLRSWLRSPRSSHSLDDDHKGTAVLSYRWLSLKGVQDNRGAAGLRRRGVKEEKEFRLAY
ncbi:MAG: hypothetical protein ABR961_14755, partial [Thermoanaerobaculaceae bacterium]